MPSLALGAPRWWMMPAALTVLVGLFVWSYYPVAAVQYRETRACAQLSAELASLQARNAG